MDNKWTDLEEKMQCNSCHASFMKKVWETRGNSVIKLVSSLFQITVAGQMFWQFCLKVALLFAMLDLFAIKKIKPVKLRSTKPSRVNKLAK